MACETMCDLHASGILGKPEKILALGDEPKEDLAQRHSHVWTLGKATELEMS